MDLLSPVLQLSIKLQKNVIWAEYEQRITLSLYTDSLFTDKKINHLTVLIYKVNKPWNRGQQVQRSLTEAHMTQAKEKMCRLKVIV